MTLGFPRLVNEKAARVVAGCVAVTAIAVLLTGWYWLVAVLAYGFLARVLAGPTFSPFAQFATRVVAPRLGEPKPVSGPPKRFAQGMGFAMTAVASVLALGLGLTGAADVLLVLLVLAAGLEAILALCLGCRIFGLLMRAGLVPDDVCAECADIWAPRAA